MLLLDDIRRSHVTINSQTSFVAQSPSPAPIQPSQTPPDASHSSGNHGGGVDGHCCYGGKGDRGGRGRGRGSCRHQQPSQPHQGNSSSSNNSRPTPYLMVWALASSWSSTQT